MRLLDLYRHTDPALARALEERVDLADDRPRRRPGDAPAEGRRAGSRRVPAPISRNILPTPPALPPNSLPATTARASARSPSTAGTRMPTKARRTVILRYWLGALDGALAAVESGMGPAWKQTVVTVVTEFGRTARINGTAGTDHGTATVALPRRRRGQRRPRHRRLAGRRRGASSTRTATSSQPPTCARCSRACCAITCASTRARSTTRCSPAAPARSRWAA